MADASALGIHPPATVRIDMGGWVQDWPWETVELLGDQVSIKGLSIPASRQTDYGAFPDGTITVIHYPYEHAHQQADGSWIFHGSETFTITAGPPQPPAMDTAGPQQ